MFVNKLLEKSYTEKKTFCNFHYFCVFLSWKMWDAVPKRVKMSELIKSKLWATDTIIDPVAEAPRTISEIKLLIDGGGLSPTWSTVRLHGHVGGREAQLVGTFFGWPLFLCLQTHSTYTHTKKYTNTSNVL